MMRLSMAGLALASLLAFSACGDDSSTPSATPTAANTVSSTATATTASPSPASATVSASASASASPTATATPTQGPPANAAEAALRLALDTLGGLPEPDCTQQRICVKPKSSPSSADLGLAAFTADTPGAGSFVAVFAKQPDQSWGSWFRSPTPYQLTSLPGNVRVCAGGDQVNVRNQPNTTGTVVAALKTGDTAYADGFVLTEPQAQANGPAGYGWYHLNGPVMGWAYSKYLADAALGDCKLHDAQEH